MPKLTSRPPQYKKSGKYAVIYIDGKRVFLGLHGSQESKVAYARALAERESPGFSPPRGDKTVTVKELAAAFLDHAKATLKKPNYTHHRIVVFDFLLKLYGDGTLVDDFRPGYIKLVREEMIRSGRLCRGMINDYICRIVRIFQWGVEEGIVHSDTAAVLKAIKPLPEGYTGTFDHEEREDVPDSVIKATLPFMPSTLRAMIKLQRLTGCRPSEIFNMRVGQIDQHSDPDLWLYRLKKHKTKNKIKKKRKKIIPLSKIEQRLIAPYLVGKGQSKSNDPAEICRILQQGFLSAGSRTRHKQSQQGFTGRRKNTTLDSIPDSAYGGYGDGVGGWIRRSANPSRPRQTGYYRTIYPCPAEKTESTGTEPA